MEFVGNIARKTGEPSLLAVESAKSRRARQIGQESGLFYVPKVVSFDAESGVLEFERLQGLITLFELGARRDERVFGLLRKAGRALAVVHENLVLPDEMKYELPAEWMARPDENVFIHGDFAGFNLCFNKSSEQLVILDWSTAPLLGRVATYGSRFFDIVWFVIYIFYGVPRGSLLSWDARRMADAFLSGYNDHFPQTVQRLAGEYLPLMRSYYRKTVWYLLWRKPWRRAGRYLLYQLLIYPRFARYRPKLASLGV